VGLPRPPLALSGEPSGVDRRFPWGLPPGPPPGGQDHRLCQQTLHPDLEIIAVRSQLLQRDLPLLEQIEGCIAELEGRLLALLAQTPVTFGRGSYLS
jgi:hypothetical protein